MHSGNKYLFDEIWRLRRQIKELKAEVERLEGMKRKTKEFLEPREWTKGGEIDEGEQAREV